MKFHIDIKDDRKDAALVRYLLLGIRTHIVPVCNYKLRTRSLHGLKMRNKYREETIKW